MGEVIQFVSKAERERARLVREARAIYDSIFPSTDPVGKQPNKPPGGRLVSGANSGRSDAGPRS